MDKEKKDEIWDNLSLEDHVIVEYDNGFLRKKPTKIEGSLWGMDVRNLWIRPEGKTRFRVVPCYTIMRLKNGTTGYDTGELHE